MNARVLSVVQAVHRVTGSDSLLPLSKPHRQAIAAVARSRRKCRLSRGQWRNLLHELTHTYQHYPSD